MATTSRKRASSEQAAVLKTSTPPPLTDAAQSPALATATEPPVASRARPKQKLVRDSFTMPKQDFELIGALKQRMIAFKRPARKSELLRAGLHGLMMLPDARLAAALDGLPAAKPGVAKKDA